MTTLRPVVLVLTEDERRHLAKHARYAAHDQEDRRTWHTDPAERARLRGRWHEIANRLHTDPFGDEG